MINKIHKQSNKTLKYRPEINGMRALAVLSVIVYHAKIDNFMKDFLPEIFFGKHLLSGGFIGVDIFFVISGYLISYLILKELQVTNRFSFSYFLERRVRRILPALLFMLVLCTFTSYVTHLQVSFVDFSKSLISSIFSFSNFYFYFTDNIYNAENSLLKPLLHTWSLSVEEQFYIFFSIILVIAYRFHKEQIIKIILSLILCSLFFAQYMSALDPSLNFYILPSRMFELLSGTLIAKLQLDRENKVIVKNYILSFFMPKLGIFLIFYSLIFFNDNMLLPSFLSLIPILGVVIFIWYANKNEFFTRILSSRILVFIGLISYSLYLFHYPIFSYVRYLNFNDQNVYYSKILLLILLTFLISVISYYFIEKPFRNKSSVSKTNLAIIVSSLILSLLTFNVYVIYQKGIKERLPPILHKPLAVDISKIEYNKLGKAGNVVLLGDSHASVLAHLLNEGLTERSMNLKRLNTRLYINEIDEYLRNTDTKNE